MHDRGFKTLDDLMLRWEDVTSTNSLQQIAKLYCGIEMDKSKRVELMYSHPHEIRRDMQDYISYCVEDVSVTHSVFKQTIPLFRSSCPSPVTMAGILTMGSSFLPVNESWSEYVRHAEAKYRELDRAVKFRLEELAELARGLMDGDAWKEDPWLSQLDWTPKRPQKRRKVSSTDEVCII